MKIMPTGIIQGTAAGLLAIIFGGLALRDTFAQQPKSPAKISIEQKSRSAAKNQEATPQHEKGEAASPKQKDLVDRVTTPQPSRGSRPEEQKSPHDSSDVFAAASAQPINGALNTQPQGGEITGFDFYRDPLNADRPMKTFTEIYEEDVAAKPRVMEDLQTLLAMRYDQEPKLDPQVTNCSSEKPSALSVIRHRSISTTRCMTFGWKNFLPSPATVLLKRLLFAESKTFLLTFMTAAA